MLYCRSSLSILYIVGVTEYKGFGAGRDPEDLSPGPRSAANLLCILERLLLEISGFFCQMGTSITILLVTQLQ